MKRLFLHVICLFLVSLNWNRDTGTVYKLSAENIPVDATSVDAEQKSIQNENQIHIRQSRRTNPKQEPSKDKNEQQMKKKQNGRKNKGKSRQAKEESKKTNGKKDKKNRKENRKENRKGSGKEKRKTNKYTKVKGKGDRNGQKNKKQIKQKIKQVKRRQKYMLAKNIGQNQKTKNENKQGKIVSGKEKSKKTFKNKSKNNKGRKVNNIGSRQNSANCFNISCLNDILQVLQAEKTTAKNFFKQKNQIVNIGGYIERKQGKKGTFDSDANLLVSSCSNSSYKDNADSVIKALLSCSGNIQSNCVVSSMDKTKMSNCNTAVIKYMSASASCQAKSGTDRCSCFATMLKEQYTDVVNCKFQTEAKKVKTERIKCMDAFTKCKDAQDNSVFIMTKCATTQLGDTATTQLVDTAITQVTVDTTTTQLGDTAITQVTGDTTDGGGDGGDGGNGGSDGGDGGDGGDGSEVDVRDTVVRIPTLGRPVTLGQLYSAHSDQFIPGYSLWPEEEIRHGKTVIWHPASSVHFATGSSREDKMKLLDADASISGSIGAGLLEVSGSASYLKYSEDKEDRASVTMSFKSITRTETISSSLTKNMNRTDCNLPVTKNSKATHVISSITFGGNSNFIFQKAVSDQEDQKTIRGELEVTLKLIFFSIHAKVSLYHHEESKSIKDEISIKVYSDFTMEKQPTTLNDTLKTYQNISSNFGSKGSLYNQSVPMSMVLIPLKLFCTDSGLAAEIGKDILKRATDIRLILLEVLDKIARLLDSRAAVGNFEVRQILQDFHSDVQNYTLDYEAKLQNAIIGARNPKNKQVNDASLVSLIDGYARSKYDYDTHLYLYLMEKTRQVNAINIFYTQTVLQDEPQIAVFSKASIPQALVSEHNLFVLTLYVLPNVTAENYTAHTNWKQNEAGNQTGWYNTYTTVGHIGTAWRSFRTFFQLNAYRDDSNFFVILDKEEAGKTMDLQLLVKGEEAETFELNTLMKLTTTLALCRTSSKIRIQVNNPPKLTGPNTIEDLLVNITKTPNDVENPPTWFKVPISKSSTSTLITIPNLVPEYSYNVTVAYNTAYGSLTPSKVVTTVGQFGQMRKTVGCQIKENMKKTSIKLMTNYTSAFDCATASLTNSSVHGWTFQLGLGNCYFNTGESNSTEEEGWAVGTQACGAFQPFDDCTIPAPILCPAPVPAPIPPSSAARITVVASNGNTIGSVFAGFRL